MRRKIETDILGERQKQIYEEEDRNRYMRRKTETEI